MPEKGSNPKNYALNINYLDTHAHKIPSGKYLNITNKSFLNSNMDKN